MQIRVKVVPNASRDEVVGWLGEALKLRVTAPPEKGKANRVVEKLLAERLGLPAVAVQVVKGRAASLKILAIEGMEEAELKQRLGSG